MLKIRQEGVAGMPVKRNPGFGIAIKRRKKCKEGTLASAYVIPLQGMDYFSLKPRVAARPYPRLLLR